MRTVLKFWCECAKIAARGRSQFANDWQWLWGVPIVGIAAAAVAGATSADGSVMLIPHHAILNGLAVAAIVFVITWMVGLLLQMPVIAARRYEAEKVARETAEEATKPKIQFIRLREIRHQTDPFGEISQDFRLVIKNIGLGVLDNCLVKVLSLDGGHHDLYPLALRTINQGTNRSAAFNLRAKEEKEVLLCVSTFKPGNTFNIAYIAYEDEALDYIPDPNAQQKMVIGLYSAAEPTYVELRWSRDNQGLLKIEASS